jgi:L-fuculose-phosphate aldolase
VDLENAYYKLEIVDAYARILLLAKQIGSIRPLDGNEMKELLELKQKFGLREPRLENGGQGFACATDFLTRVGDVATKGRMQAQHGTVPAPVAPGSELRPSTAVQASPMEQAIHSLAPGNYSEQDIEVLVQTITDQIMAAAG